MDVQDGPFKQYYDGKLIKGEGIYVNGLLEGKKYRRPCWRKGRKSIWTFCDRGELIGKIKGADLIANDWIEEK